MTNVWFIGDLHFGHEAIERIISHLEDTQNYKKDPYIPKSSNEIFGRDLRPPEE